VVAPKPQSLCATVAGHHSALEADLARYYPGTDLLDLWRGNLSWRRLAQLVRWLPKEAALYQSMRLARPVTETPDDDAKLVVSDYLEVLRKGTPEHLADLLLTLVNLNEARIYAESDKDKRGEFAPTLAPGYSRPGAAAAEIDWNDPEFAAYRAAYSTAAD
jgi:hypothetical protein